MSTQWMPLSVRHSSPLVQALWLKGIDKTSVQVLKRLEDHRTLIKLPIGYWLKGSGWSPTLAVLAHALKKNGLIAFYQPHPDRTRLRSFPSEHPASHAHPCN